MGGSGLIEQQNFLLCTLAFELGTSGSAVMHSLTISGILLWSRGIMGGSVLIGPQNFLLSTLGFEPGTSVSAALHSTTKPL